MDEIINRLKLLTSLAIAAKDVADLISQQDFEAVEKRINQLIDEQKAIRFPAGGFISDEGGEYVTPEQGAKHTHMINPSELKVNNLVFASKRQVFIIEGVKKPFNENKNNWSIFGRSIYDRYKASPSININPFPIPITLSWLLMLGWKRMDFGAVSFPAGIEINEDGDALCIDKFGEIRIYVNNDDPSTVPVNCKFIHQVQNLMSALNSIDVNFDFLAEELATNPHSKGCF